MDEIKVINPWGHTIFTSIEGSFHTFKTEKAKITLLTNPYFGRMLFIDDILQSAEVDEEMYHKMIVRLVNIHYLPRVHLNYLVAGGAEGAVTRELLKYSPSSITMVDWDKELVDHMKGEVWHKGSYSDSRLKVVNDDILSFLQKNTKIYDCIILDLLDPTTEDEISWLLSVILEAWKYLRNNSTLVANVGGDKKIAGAFCNKLRSYSPIVDSLYIPSFQGEWFFLSLRKW
jgi:spermidine synthase